MCTRTLRLTCTARLKIGHIFNRCVLTIFWRGRCRRWTAPLDYAWSLYWHTTPANCRFGRWGLGCPGLRLLFLCRLFKLILILLIAHRVIEITIAPFATSWHTVPLACLYQLPLRGLILANDGRNASLLSIWWCFFTSLLFLFLCDDAPFFILDLVESFLVLQARAAFLVGILLAFFDNLVFLIWGILLRCRRVLWVHHDFPRLWIFHHLLLLINFILLLLLFWVTCRVLLCFNFSLLGWYCLELVLFLTHNLFICQTRSL